MKIISHKTTFAGKIWFGDKHLGILEEGESILAKYQNDVMTITPKDLPILRMNRSTRFFKDRKTGVEYWLWGIKWKPDVDKQASLFNQ